MAIVLTHAIGHAKSSPCECHPACHQGTFTSQAAGKQGNRLCEALLRVTELLAVHLRLQSAPRATAASTAAAPDVPSDMWHVTDAARAVDDPRDVVALTCPAQLRQDVWERVLLCQFHDVLPGSSIGAVHHDARTIHTQCLALLDDLIRRCAARSLGLTTPAVLQPQLVWPAAAATWHRFDGLAFTPPGSEDATVDSSAAAAADSVPLADSATCSAVSVFNPCSVQRDVVVAVPANKPVSRAVDSGLSRECDGIAVDAAQRLVRVVVPPMSGITVSTAEADAAADTTGTAVTAVHGTSSDGAPTLTIGNGIITVTLCMASARVLSMVDHRCGDREAISSTRAGNAFTLFDDVPFYWDAWDVMPYHLETAREVNGRGCVGARVDVTECGPLRVVGRAVLPLLPPSSTAPAGAPTSTIRQLIVVTQGSPVVTFECEVDWHETHKLLKVEFPLALHATEAAFETQVAYQKQLLHATRCLCGLSTAVGFKWLMHLQPSIVIPSLIVVCWMYAVQFGYLKRPVTTNTSWEVAKYEVCGHRWADISEYGFGVALLNDSKYGFCCRNNTIAMVRHFLNTAAAFTL